MAPRNRNPLTWLWVAVPPLVVLVIGLIIHLLLPHGLLPVVPFALFGLASLLVNQLLNDLRRRPDAPARVGWVFHRPFRLGCARVGRAFAGGCLVVLAMLFVTTDVIPVTIAACLAAVPCVTGGLQLVHLVRDTPAVRLSPGGFDVYGRSFPWAILLALELNGDRFNPRLDLLIAGRRQPLALRPADVDTSLLFLLDLLGYYQSHPERRDAIGDEQEAWWIHEVLLAARLAAGLRGGPTPITVGTR